MRKRVLDFIDFNDFITFYKPLTPYGQTHRSRMELHSDPEVITSLLDLTESALVYIQIDEAQADRLEYHLKRIPRLPAIGDMADPADLFLFKKFLINFRAVCRLASSELRRDMGLSFNLAPLLEELSRSGSEETFYLADSYSPELSELRARIRDQEDRLASLRESRIEFIRSVMDLDFRFRDFLIISEGHSRSLDSTYLFMEPHDSGHLLIKPIMCEEYYSLLSQRDQLASMEKAEENLILARLAGLVASCGQELQLCTQAMERLDIHMARARLCLEFDMIRPDLLPAGSNISVDQGRFIPQELKCSSLGTRYQPLTVGFDNPIAVIPGSNMGGKTVLLKTIGFLQVLTQMGFHVPAAGYSAPLFKGIFHIGETGRDYLQGLSSFGLEIFNFMNTWKTDSGSSLYLIDEFARTTGSLEASALIQSILTIFARRGDIHCLLSTHFMDLLPACGASFYRMKGLNRQAFQDFLGKMHHGHGQDDLLRDMGERIRTINRFMDYQVISDSRDSLTSDALDIAALLGFDPEALELARRHMEELAPQI